MFFLEQAFIHTQQEVRDLHEDVSSDHPEWNTIENQDRHDHPDNKNHHRDGYQQLAFS